jgi:hypothetical protein
LRDDPTIGLWQVQKTGNGKRKVALPLKTREKTEEWLEQQQVSCMSSELQQLHQLNLKGIS